MFISPFNPHATNIAAMAGFDCIWIDNEHEGQNWVLLQSHVCVVKNHDVDLNIPSKQISSDLLLCK